MLRVALSGDRVVYFQAEEQPLPLQLAAFARECSELVGGIEIDVVGINKKGYTILRSCKWWKEEAGENVLDDLLEGRAALGPKASQADLAIFSKSGFNGKLTARAKNEGVHLITIDDLFT